MTKNLVAYIMQLLTPEMIGRVATGLGLDPGKVQRAIGAAIPAILAGLGGVAAQPGGADKIADAVGQQDSSLGELTGMLASGKQGSLANDGVQLMSSLFGSGDSSALANAVSQYAGLDGKTGSSLLAMLTPLVLGGLAEQSDGDLSPGNMTGILASQKANIAAALPAGIGELLAGTGLLGGLGASVRSATATASQAASQTAARTTETLSSVASASQRTAADVASNSFRWLYWLIAALILAAVLYYIFGRAAQAPVAPQTQTTTQEQPAMTADVGKHVSDTLAGLQTALGGVTDAASATAALPKVQAAAVEIDKIQATLGQMTVEQKAALATTVKPILATLNGLFDKILAIPGVSDVLRPAIDSLKVKLAALAA